MICDEFGLGLTAANEQAVRGFEATVSAYAGFRRPTIVAADGPSVSCQNYGRRSPPQNHTMKGRFRNRRLDPKGLGFKQIQRRTFHAW